MTIPFDKSFLPWITLYPKGNALEHLEAFLGSVVKDENTNLAPQSKHLLQWHFKLGHPGFSHVRQLGLGGFLDSLLDSGGNLNFLQSENVQHVVMENKLRNQTTVPLPVKRHPQLDP